MPILQPLATSLALLAVALCLPSTAAPAPTPQAYRELARQVDENLRKEILAKWFPAAIDPVGGFYQNFDEAWNHTGESAKSIVYQSRLTWLACQAAKRYPARAAEYRKAAAHGFDCLQHRMWDSRDGGFFWEIGPDGGPLRDGEKHAYGISFALYACSAYYRLTLDPAAKSLATRTFEWMEKHSHDTRNGGYYEALTRAGSPILTPPAASSGTDEIGTRYGFKSMNSHIHLLESLTEFYAVDPRPQVRARLEEVFKIVRDRVVVSQIGVMNQFFTPDWRPVPDLDSFGHDVETAFLLVEASSALGRPEDPAVWLAARRLVDHALEAGFDLAAGLADSGTTFRKVYIPERVWWVQAECVNALLLMHEKFGRETSRYWTAFTAEWEFIRSKQIDSVHGGWYNSVSPEGAAPAGAPKSDSWTEGYHQGRAMLRVSEVLQKLSAGREAR